MLRRVTHLHVAREIYRRRQARNGQGRATSVFDAVAPRSSSKAVDPISFIPDMEEAPPRQIIALTSLVIFAIVTGISVETSTYAMKVGLFIGLCVFIALTSSVHFIGKGSVVTMCMLIGAISLLILTSGASAAFLSHNYALLIPCQSILVVLALIYLVACTWGAEAMHIWITWAIVVPPTLVAILMTSLPLEHRLMFVLPAIALIAYKAAAVACCNCPALPRKRTLVKTLLYCSGLVTFIGAAVAATALAIDEPWTKVFLAAYATVIVGGIAFNACLVVWRWETPDPFEEIGVEMLISYAFMCLSMFTLITVDLLLVYFALEYKRIVVIPPILIAICLYFGLLWIQNRVRGATFAEAYFALILPCIFCAVFCMRLAQPLDFIFYDTTADEESEAYHKVTKEIAHTETMYWVALECFLVIVYLMMTGLVKTDDLADEAAAALEAELVAVDEEAANIQETARSALKPGPPAVSNGTSTTAIA